MRQINTDARLKSGQKSSLLKAFQSNFYMMKLVFEASPKRVIGEFARRACEYLRRIFFGIIFWQVILRYVEEGEDFQKVLPFLIFTVLFVFALYLCSSYFYNVIRPEENQVLYEKMHVKMFEKAADVELACFENPEFYNKYLKAVTQVKTRAHMVMWVMSGFIVSNLTMVYLLYTTIKIDPVAILFSVLPMISTYVIGKKINSLNYELYQKNVIKNRQKEYVKRSIYQQDLAKELRLSNGFLLLMHYFGSAVNDVVENTKKYGLKVGLLSCLSEGISQVLVTAGSILYASVRLLYFKNLEISDYIVLINAIAQISSCLTGNALYLTRIQDNHLYIQNIRDFFSYEPEISESQQGREVDRSELLLELKDVSFSYFGQEKEVLHDICMSIGRQEKIVLVGENGAGKSTLVKLLLRLYDPTKGQVELNGTDIKDYCVKKYRDIFGTVFQDYCIFGLTVAENVLLRPMEEKDVPVVEQALKSSGIYEKVMTLPKGIHTVLTREFDPEGAVLSGGEMQKIAIARVFAKDCDIVILDEPSSALDPIAEHEMYQSMLKACEKKAMVFISHRLSAAVLADKIYMLEHGRVVESGTHKELMEKNGKYAKMFLLQAKNYIGETA